MAFLALSDLSFTYPVQTSQALSGVSFELLSGELLTVVGPTGSGKSTLLRLIKPELRQNGSLSGSVTLDGEDVTSLSPAGTAGRIAFVAQNPEEQIVTDSVWHELAFTLESLGAKQSEIARRVAEVASFFGIESWYRRKTCELSGGQKQLLNLAAAMTADPRLLILDEPTAQLDPISALRFIEAVRRLNTELGLTVIVTEHRAEELIPISDKLLILDRGRMVAFDHPRAIASSLAPDSAYTAFMPCAARLFSAVGGASEAPLSIREGKRFLSEKCKNDILSLDEALAPHSPEPALELHEVYYRYNRSDPDVLRGLSLSVYKGEVFAVLGANGVGKSTLVKAAAGLIRPYSGRVKLFGLPLSKYPSGSLYSGVVSLLPQDVESVFIKPTVGEELKGCEGALSSLPFDLTPLFGRHPYDLSGGERQLVALCKALSTDPRLLILDEPSKGLDPISKRRLASLILSLKDRGVTVLIVSHDVEFAALCADSCALLFEGAVAASGSTAEFMSSNRFYTTPASRLTRHIYRNAYTVSRAAQLIQKNGGPR